MGFHSGIDEHMVTKMNKYLEYKFGKRSRKRKASEGMTAAIILIAFIITAAGIAFVILTMGSEMQIELGNVGKEGKDSASSALQVEGNIITGYANGGGNIIAYAFNVKLVLGTGQVDLSDDALTLWISVNHGEEFALTQNTSITGLANAVYSDKKYDLTFYDANSGTVLDPDEMARFYIGVKNNAAAESQDVVITLNTGVATLRIEKTIPIGITASSTNFL